MESNKKASTIKSLLAEGFSEKSIVMILQVQQPYVNKIKNGKLHVNTPAEMNLTDLEREKYEAVKKIFNASELPTNKVEEQDIYYIHLLRFFNVPKEKIHGLYNHMAVSKVDRIMRKKGVDLGFFDSTLLGIPKEIYLDLIIDYI